MTPRIQKVTVRGAVAIAAALALHACTANDFTRPPDGTVFVRVGDTFFQPGTVNVPLGRSVRWTNEGALQHTVVADSVPWQSGLLSPQWWFEVRFDSLGTFTYHCSVHPGMTGTVLVQ